MSRTSWMNAHEKKHLPRGYTSARRGSRLCGLRNLLPGSALARGVCCVSRRPARFFFFFQVVSRRTREVFFRHHAD
jgi:hypothetical protein